MEGGFLEIKVQTVCGRDSSELVAANFTSPGSPLSERKRLSPVSVECFTSLVVVLSSLCVFVFFH